MIVGFTFILIYLNLFSFGYTFKEYLFFVFSRVEVDVFFVGFILQFFLIRKDIE